MSPESGSQQPMMQSHTVKVIYMTCCPVRVQFSTGSDNGLGRVWEDYDDARIGMIVENGRGEDNSLGRERMIH